MPRDWTDIMDAPLPVAEAVSFVTDPSAGGIAVFLGTTRAQSGAGGETLIALHYEAYVEMAREQLRALAAKARSQWELAAVAILHRIGQVPVAQPSVVIAVSSAHRSECFAACRFLIDTLKADTAIWKKEIFSDGSGRWVHPV